MSGTDIQPPEVISSSVEGSIVTLVVKGRYTGLDGKPAEEVNSVRFKHSESGYKLMLTPQLEAMATPSGVSTKHKQRSCAASSPSARQEPAIRVSGNN